MGCHPIIPPRKNARIRKGNAFTSRNAAVAACRRLGREVWKAWIGYHRRSLVETTMYALNALVIGSHPEPVSAKSTSCISVQRFSIDAQNWAVRRR